MVSAELSSSPCGSHMLTNTTGFFDAVTARERPPMHDISPLSAYFFHLVSSLSSTGYPFSL